VNNEKENIGNVFKMRVNPKNFDVFMRDFSYIRGYYVSALKNFRHRMHFFSEEEAKDYLEKRLMSAKNQIFNDINKKSFLDVAVLMDGLRRMKDHKIPYFSHIASAAYLYWMISEQPQELKDRTIEAIIWHDFLDMKGEELDKNSLEDIRKSYDKGYGEGVISSLLLGAPANIYDFLKGRFGFYTKIAENIFSVKQVVLYGDKMKAGALVFDKLDNQLDFEYIRHPDIRAKKLAQYIAYNFFVLQEMRSFLPRDLLDDVRLISEGNMKRNKVSKKEFNEWKKIYDEINSEKYHSLFVDGIKRYHEHFGYDLEPNNVVNL
jgi:hypothetical protein